MTTSQTEPNETVAFVAQVCDADIGGPCSTTGAAPFTLGAAPDPLNVSTGQSANTTIAVTPNAGFTQPVSLSSGGSPVGASCRFTPITVTLAGTSVVSVTATSDSRSSSVPITLTVTRP